MSELSKKRCKPCEDKSGKLAQSEANELLEQINTWKINGEESIEKTLHFKDFRSALDFVNKVGEIAESENHHPDISIFSWNKVKLKLSTHSISGLSENDFILASKIDEIIN